MEGLLQEEREGGRKRSLGTTVMEEKERGRGRKRKKETGDGQGPPFIRESSKYAQEVFSVAAAEDISCQDPKSRPVQMSEC